MSEMHDEELMTPGELAAFFKVNIRTVARWADDGKIKGFRTPGGQRRFRRSDVADILNEEG